MEITLIIINLKYLDSVILTVYFFPLQLPMDENDVIYIIYVIKCATARYMMVHDTA